MAAGSVARVLRIPGRIVVGPTDLSTTYPYGGTEVGKSKLCALQPLGTPFRVEYESLGEAGEILEPNVRYLFVCFLRGWDDDAVQHMLANGYAAGGTTQHATWSAPGNVPGAAASGRAKIVLYVPDDTVHANAVLIYSGIPWFQDGAELMMQRGEEFGLGMAVDCLRDTNDNMVAIGRLPDLSLT